MRRSTTISQCPKNKIELCRDIEENRTKFVAIFEI